MTPGSIADVRRRRGQRAIVTAAGKSSPLCAGHLIELLDDPAARRRMGEAGREIVAGHDIRRTLAAFEALCLHAAGHPAATTALPLPFPISAMESEHDEYAARSGRR
ncbi:hypothetical protein [Streptomyces flaveus]|uniref:hypothetical protein n=1 Tax=Streptomyces flaveus TaxID=66370 RepID=UPI0033249677